MVVYYVHRVIPMESLTNEQKKSFSYKQSVINHLLSPTRSVVIMIITSGNIAMLHFRGVT